MNWISEELGISTSVQAQLLASLLVIAGLVIVRWTIIRALGGLYPDEEEVVYRTRKITAYTGTILGVITLGFIWIEAFNDFGTYLGLVSAGVAIALSDLLKNMAGWGYILTRRPFRIGDRIEIRGIRGDVIDIRLFRFSLMEVGNWVDSEQSTGRLVHVPNGMLFSHEVANYTEGFPYIWDEVPVLITFESDYRRGEEILYDALRANVPDVEARAGREIREAAQRYQIKVGALTPIVYLTVRDSGVLLTGRYLTEVRRRRAIEQGIWRHVLDALAADPSVELAYPTVRTFFQGPIELAGEAGRRQSPEDG